VLSTMPWKCMSNIDVVKLHTLTSALDGGDWSSSHCSHFTTGERDPGTHWIGGWVGPRASLDVLVKRKFHPC
jgi:hypothetical protein